MSCCLLFFGLLQPLHIPSFSTVVLAVITKLREAVILHELFYIIVAYYFQTNIIILYCEFYILHLVYLVVYSHALWASFAASSWEQM